MDALTLHLEKHGGFEVQDWTTEGKWNVVIMKYESPQVCSNVIRLSPHFVSDEDDTCSRSP